MKAGWKLAPFEVVVRSRGSGATGLPTSEWLDSGAYPVVGQGAQDIEGWTDRLDLLLTPTSAVVLYGGHTRRAKHVEGPFVAGPNVKILEPAQGLDCRLKARDTPTTSRLSESHTFLSHQRMSSAASSPFSTKPSRASPPLRPTPRGTCRTRRRYSKVMSNEFLQGLPTAGDWPRLASYVR